MDFFSKLVGFLITKHAIRSYQKNLRNEYYRNQALLAEHESRLAQLKQEEGDHSAEIEEEELWADYERDMVRIYKKNLGIDG